MSPPGTAPASPARICRPGARSPSRLRPPTRSSAATGISYRTPAALDLDGEWTFEAGSRTITVLLAAATPAAHKFAVSATETLIAVSASRGVTIDGVRLVGARRANLEIRQSARIRIQGIESQDSAIGGSMNHRLDVFNCTDCVLERNRISDIATVAGMRRSGNGQYNTTASASAG